jgi:spore maturation protein CgeB
VPGRLLIVSPAFHGIWRSVQSAFAGLGWDVATHRYDEYAGLTAKLRNKVRYELPERVGRSTRELRRRQLGAGAVQAVRTFRPDAVLTVKGDQLGPAYWDCLDELRLPRATWLYDQLAAMDHEQEELPRLGGIGSFSHHDTELLRDRGLTAEYVALGFDPAFTPTGSRTGGVVFAGARYPRREELLLGLQARGVPVVVYGRDWSRHPVDRARTWGARRPDLPSGRDLSRERMHRVMEAADATVNVHGSHLGGQDGFTLRTFEAAGIGAVQLIDRADVSQFYEPGSEVAVYDGAEELAELCRRAVDDLPWADRIRERGRHRTLAEHTFAHRAQVLASLLREPP